MLKGKEKVIKLDDEKLDVMSGLLADPAFDLRIPLKSIRSSVRTNAKRTSPEITSLPCNSGDEGSSGSDDTLSKDSGEDSGEVSSPGVSRPGKKRKEKYGVKL